MNIATFRTSWTAVLALATTLFLCLLPDAAAFSTGSPGPCGVSGGEMAAHGGPAAPSPNGWSIEVPLSYTAGTPLTVGIANTNSSKQFRGLLLSAAKDGTEPGDAHLRTATDEILADGERLSRALLGVAPATSQEGEFRLI